MKQKKSFTLQIFAKGEEQPYSLQVFTSSSVDVAKRLSRQVYLAHGDLADHGKLYDLSSADAPEQGQLILEL